VNDSILQGQVEDEEPREEMEKQHPGRWEEDQKVKPSGTSWESGVLSRRKE
jgi:hypothetical protein